MQTALDSLDRQYPKHWSVKELSSFCDVSSGGTPRRSQQEYFNGEIPWVKIGDMANWIISETEEKITKLGLGNSAARVFPKGTILISIFATIGTVSILGIDAATNQAIAGVIPNPKIADNRYLAYFLASLKPNLEAISRGVAQRNINQTILKSVKVPLPPLAEQRAVADILEKIRKLRGKRERASQLTNKIIQSVFLKMFGRNKFPRKEIREHIIKTEVRDPRKQPNETFKYVDIAGIDNKRGAILETKEILGKDAPSRARRVIRTGDVIVSTVRPNLNATALVPATLDNQICSTGFCVLRCKPSMSSQYLYAFTRRNEFIEALSLKMKGASYPAVTNDDVLDVEIPVPPIELQNRFSAILEKIRSMSEGQKQSTQEINELFHSLMHKAFRGELKTAEVTAKA